MAINNFISTVWSENLLRSLDQSYVTVSHCNREFDGDIKESGAVVNICGIQNIDVMNYEKGEGIPSPHPLEGFTRELKIDQAKCFNFLLDDVDRAQSNPKLMETAMKAAANELAKEAERYVFSLYETVSTEPLELDPTNKDTIITAILLARQTLMLNGVTDMSQVVLEVSPEVASILLRAKLALCHDQNEIVENGSLGKIMGIPVFVSPYVVGSGNIYGAHACIMRTRRSVAFAEQLSEIEAYRPEGMFADAVKGLHLYGASIIYPDEYIPMIFHNLTPE